MENTDRTADYFHIDNGTAVCDLCPHRCRIGNGYFGLCRARYSEGNRLTARSYGRVSSLAIDPVEKKPLYHYFPGSDILSVGGIGCNMRCKHCQNHSISQAELKYARTDFISPADLVMICRREGLDKIAFTYNEPSVWFEYIMDTVNEDPSLKYVLVTNGLINEDPMKELCRHMDAMNIDVKGFTDRFYHDICGAELSDIKRSVRTAFEEGVHIELTYLLIPGLNNSDDELHEFGKWIAAELSTDIPVHVTRFHPDNLMMDVPCTPIDSMKRAKGILRSEGIKFIYLGNTNLLDENNTYCPECGRLFVERNGFEILRDNLKGPVCPDCGCRIPFRTE